MHRNWILGLAMLFAGSALAGLPVGSVVIYSDGTAEKLIEKGEGLQRWQDDRKRLSVRSTNPILPKLERRTFLSGKGYRQQLIRGNPDSIRGLRWSDTPVEFTLLRTREDGSKSQRHWECRALGASTKKVAGVQRMIENYHCERFNIHRKLHNRDFRERRELSYSPELDLVVDMKRETRTRKARRKLVRVYLPDDVSYRRISRALRKVRGGD